MAHPMLWLAAALVVGTAHPGHASPLGRRFIAAGPATPEATTLRAHLNEFEKFPFDGAVILPTRRLADGTTERADFAFSRHPWQPAEMEAMVAELKETKPSRARDLFLAVQARPGDVDWFDDTGWRETVDHWRLLARAAKLGGLRGLAFEPARDAAAASPFHYPSQSRRAEKDFAAYAKVARDRGRDIMLAVTAEFPEAVILSHGLYSEFLPLLAGEASPASLLPTHPLGLLPAFLDGWWDAVPPKVQIIDGNAPGGRRATTETDFQRAYTWLRTQGVRLAAPEHRAKLRAQFLVGQTLDLDQFLPAAAPTPPRTNGTTIAPHLQLTAAATAALRASDGWIWVDGQAGRWWPGVTESAPPPWPDVFSGVTTAIARARTPFAAAREVLTAASPAENRLSNGDFAKEGREGLPEKWWTWQRDDSRGTARREAAVTDANLPPTAVWSAATDAHFGQEVAVKLGETYALGTRVKTSGQGIATLKVGWKDAKGQWTSPDASLIVPTEGVPDPEGWHELAAIIRVPPGAAQLVVMLGAQGQFAPEDRIGFARAVVVRL